MNIDLRDYFAGQAPRGFIKDAMRTPTFETMAREAYLLADAMLAARDKDNIYNSLLDWAKRNPNAYLRSENKPADPPKREWVGLTREERFGLPQLFYKGDLTIPQLVAYTEELLRDKNT